MHILKFCSSKQKNYKILFPVKRGMFAFSKETELDSTKDSSKNVKGTNRTFKEERTDHACNGKEI